MVRDSRTARKTVTVTWHWLIAMATKEKTLARLLGGGSDSSLPFEDVRELLLSLGFAERIKGSHHIFSRPDLPEVLNLQPVGAKAKPYQVKQVRNLLLKYRLGTSNGS